MRKGFTLIELLVVITILAVLAGAALPYVQNYVEESRVAKAKTDLEEIARAIAVYETREGDYLKGTVEDLTGRYLNKAPIDPWGRPYIIATASGLVISSGPDRDYDVITMSDDSNADNIQVPYQPPLALVSVKWVDRNQSGAVDTQNSTDTIQLLFSRFLQNGVTDFDETGSINDYFVINGTSTPFEELVSSDSAKIVANRTLVYELAVNNAFVPGSDSIEINSTHGTIIDMAGNLSLASQPVKILPQ